MSHDDDAFRPIDPGSPYPTVPHDPSQLSALLQRQLVFGGIWAIAVTNEGGTNVSNIPLVRTGRHEDPRPEAGDLLAVGEYALESNWVEIAPEVWSVELRYVGSPE